MEIVAVRPCNYDAARRQLGPKFYRDSLNDELWGDGFTDWDNLHQAPTKNRKGYEILRSKG